MNDDRFHIGLNIASYCITMASDDLLDVAEYSEYPALAEKLLRIRENLDDCVLIIETLKHYWLTQPAPSLDMAHMWSYLWLERATQP
ncbi:hypothetical protein [Pseudomonas sp. F(2018)]|jgi:hypothetical protein|uniref:hypothetical protein n=1 Tax=Pseudomonas sp. F(2018) TaxID=2502240 RepID=UPI0010F4A173|nr:hypothetical protein [Pseudomonas sp. F(2018)]